VRKPLALIVSVTLLASLTGCSFSSGSECTSEATSGDASKLITAQGDFGSAPTVSFGTPLYAKNTERTELLTGLGATVSEGNTVVADLTLLNGTTGEVLQKTTYDGKSSRFTLSDSLVPGLEKGLLCSTVGSRVGIAIPPADGFGPNSAGLGIGPDDTAVLVIDILKTYPARADGVSQPAQSGFPSVVLGADGRPGITISSGTPPNELKVATLKKGGGPIVADGDIVTLQYTGVVWANKTVFDSSWEKGSPAQIAAASEGTLADGVIPGLVGQTVGSQYIVVVPPHDGFGDHATQTIPAGSTLVFVVDILGID